MLNSLPAQVDPIRLAEEGARLIGELPLKPLHRLASLCANDQAQVAVDLQFARVGNDRWEMRGSIRGVFTVMCQRCLQPFALTLAVTPAVWFARSAAEERQLMDDTGQEAVLADHPLPLASLVEEELLLAFPMIPAHVPAECHPQRTAAMDADEDQHHKSSNPFAVLAELKKQDK